MPQPIRKTGIGYRSYPKHVLDRPQIAMLIGAIAAEWGCIDDMLAHIFASVSGGSKIIPVGVLSLDELARESFHDIAALELRLKILQKALAKTVSPSETKSFGTIARKIRSRSKERAIAIHGNWRVAEDYPDDLVLLKPDGSAHLYTENDFQQMLDSIAAIGSELRQFIINLGGYLCRRNETP